MKQRRRDLVIVVCAIVALVGISLLIYSFRPKATILSASTKEEPTSIPQNATLTIFSNPVSILLPNEEATKSATSGMIVPQGTIIMTGETGRAQIVYPQGTVTRLDYSTEVRLTTFKPQTYTISVDLFKGKIWSRIKKLLGNESYETRTSDTVATVRGTSYEHSVTGEDEDQVLVTEGTVDFSCNKRKDLAARVKPNIKAVVHCDTDTTLVPVPVTKPDLEDDWVKFNTEQENTAVTSIPSVTRIGQSASPHPSTGLKPTDDSKKKREVIPSNPLNTLAPSVIPTVTTTGKTTTNTLNRIIDTVVSVLPTSAPRPTSVPPTAVPPSPTLSPSSGGITVNVNLSNLNLNVGLGSSGANVGIH
jgi:hypothetical protein